MLTQSVAAATQTQLTPITAVLSFPSTYHANGFAKQPKKPVFQSQITAYSLVILISRRLKYQQSLQQQAEQISCFSDNSLNIGCMK